MKRILLLFAALVIGGTIYAQWSESFLTTDQLPNSLKVLKEPPAKESAQFVYDQNRYFWGKALRNTPRGEMALNDCDASITGIVKAFSGAFGVEINEKETPEIYRLIWLAGNDAGNATGKAKDHYMRMRPYVYFNDNTCFPPDEEGLSKNGSYPSGHTARGFASALILSELNPDNQDTLLRRGYEFGISRVICGFHWQSDVDAAMTVAAGVVARLHADPAFNKQLQLAKDEFARLRKEGRVKHVDVKKR